MVRPDLEMSSLSASGLVTSELIRVYSGTVDINDVEAEMELGVYHWQERMFQEATTFLYLFLPEKTGFLLQSYLYNMQQNNEIWSGLVYAIFVEMMVGVQWTKPTSKEHAIAQLDAYLERIKDRLLIESLRDRGLEAN